MTKMGRAAALFLLVPVLSAHVAAAQAEFQAVGDLTAAEACLAFARGLSLGAALPQTRARLRSKQTLTIVTFGSSSTSGLGTLSADRTFPDVMKQELSRLRPSAQIEVINSGRIFDTIPGNIRRLQADVLRHKPDLVVWQLGTNDVVWRGVVENARELLIAGVRHLKANNADVVLMDLQYAPIVRALARHSQMQTIITDVAREERVGLFPRFLLMKRAIDAGVTGIVSWDMLHNSAAGYNCIGRALGQMIVVAAERS
jgi:acyl-CoA thioesterase-1